MSCGKRFEHVQNLSDLHKLPRVLLKCQNMFYDLNTSFSYMKDIFHMVYERVFKV